MASLGTDQERLDFLDNKLNDVSSEDRQRLATYVRRYMSPSLVSEMFEQGQLHTLIDECVTDKATVIIADIRGFTPHTLDQERRGRRSLRAVADLLQSFFDNALQTVFEHKGVMGEFSGDRFMAVFGAPVSQQDDADRALLAALEIYDNAYGLNRKLLIQRQHHSRFDIGIGVSTGGPVWIGDIGSNWRREWTMIGSILNQTSRVEELTKVDEFSSVDGYNIILTQSTMDDLSDALKNALEFKEFPPRILRGLGDDKYPLFKIVRYYPERVPGHLGIRINRATSDLVDVIAQHIESVQEREDAVRLGEEMQKIGQAISSSLRLDEILESVMDGVQQFLFATTASLLLIEEGTDLLHFKAVRPKANLPALQSVDLAVGTGLAGYVAAKGEPMCLYDAYQDSRFDRRADSKTGYQTHSVLCVPIRLEGKITGVIQVIDSQLGKFNQDDLRILESIAAFTASAIRNTQQYAAVTEAETLAAMSVVTSDMAHQIKNSVGIIKSASQSLLEKLDSDDVQLDKNLLHTKLIRILSNADKTLSEMDEIRYPFSELKLETVSLEELLESAIEFVQAGVTQRADVSVERKYLQAPEILTDRTRLSSVFVKIIENAIKAMEESPRKTLTVEIAQLNPAQVRVAISDTGSGIPPAQRAQLFRPSPKNASSTKGTGWGYGLWSSRMIIRSMGGSLYVDDVFSGGTRMILDLPRMAGAPAST